MLKILVFAGTTEGRNVVAKLINRGHCVHVSVATDYGKELLEISNGVRQEEEKRIVHTGRLSVDQMKDLMVEENIDLVVDTTHPFATEVTKNIKQACYDSGKKYMRLLRESSDCLDNKDFVYVDSMIEAADLLNQTNEKALLTVGSKELKTFINVKEYKERLFARVLPMEDVLKSCSELGFTGKRLICMQGPFSYELNKAMLQQLGCSYLVTKDSGKEGGLPEKYRAAKDAGATLIVIGRPSEEDGYSLDELLDTIQKIDNKEFSSDVEVKQKAFDNERKVAVKVLEPATDADWFPLFKNIRETQVVVIGAGKIAQRRIETLLKFSCNLKVVAKNVSIEVLKLLSQAQNNKGNKKIEIEIKNFEEEDLLHAQIVLAATNSRELNQKIGQICKQRGILVNVADSKEECDFYFPGVVLKEQLIVGITAGGQDHALAKKAGTIIRQAVEKSI